jgi:hypothetical protein
VKIPNPVIVKKLGDLTVHVRMSRPLHLRLNLMLKLFRIAVWVGGVGLEVSFKEPEATE